jgi:hypothetical protein
VRRGAPLVRRKCPLDRLRPLPVAPQLSVTSQLKVALLKMLKLLSQSRALDWASGPKAQLGALLKLAILRPSFTLSPFLRWSAGSGEGYLTGDGFQWEP